MEHRELVRLLKNAVTAGAEKALTENTALPDFLAKAEAYRLYGRSNVDRWISEKLVHLVSPDDGNSNKIIERKQLEAIAASSNRISYLPVADRNK